MKRLPAFLLCVVPQFLVVAAVAAREELALHAGVEVRLEVRPVDPMSLFAGRYIRVPLAIVRLDPRLARVGTMPAPGETIWVRLERGEPFWKPVELTREPPRDPDAVFLRGTWTASNLVDYGIDAFYIPDDGADPSRLELTAVVRVARDGRGVIEDLLVGNRTYAQWNATQKSR